MSKTKVTVTLSGEGADELFAGYLTYRANRLARTVRHFPSSGVRLGLAGLAHWPVSDDKISFEYKIKRFLEGCLVPADRAHVYWNGTFSDTQKSALLHATLPAALDRTLGSLRERTLGSDDLAPYLWFDQKYFLPDDILNKVDRMSMAHAVEVRPPFLDHRIVEFAARIPASLKIRGSRQKFLLKELMRGKLPPIVLSRKKMGFDIPAHEWLRGPLRPLLLDTFSSASAEHSGLFASAAMEAVLRQHLERRANLGYQLWGLLILFLWMRQWNIQTDPLSALNSQSVESILASA